MALGQPIASAAVEVRLDLSKLSGDASSVSDEIHKLLGAGDPFASVKSDAAKAGEAIEGAFSEAAKTSDSKLDTIGGADVWNDITTGAQRTGEKVEDAFQEAARTSDKALGGIGGKLAGLGIGVAVAGGMKFAVNEASNLSESINAVNVTFGDSAAGISALGKEAAESLGLSESKFNGLAVQFSSFASTIAGPGGDVVATMDDITTRASDFASVMNLDVADAAGIFQAGLAGETDGLKKFGIDLSGAAVEAYALAQGIIAPGEAMTEQQKVQARYGALMEQTAKTQGDFANTSDGAANAQRILSAKTADLAAKLGSVLLPILAAVATFVSNVIVPAIEAIANNFEYVIPILAALVVGIVAYNLASIQAAIASAAAWLLAAAPFIAIGVAIAALVAGVIWAYQNVEIFRTIIDGAVTVLKAIASFIIDVLVGAFNGIVAVVQTVVGVFTDFPGTITGAWDAVMSFVSELPGKIGAFIGEVVAFFTGLPAQVGEALLNLITTVGEKIGSMALQALAAVGQFILDFLEWYITLPFKVGSALLGLASTVVGKVGEMATSALSAVGTFVTDALNKVGEFVTGIPGKLLDLGSKIGSAISGGLATGLTAVGTWVTDALNKVGEFVTGIPGKILNLGSTLVSGLKSALKSAWNTVIDFLPSFTIPNPIPFADDWKIDPASWLHWNSAGGIFDRPTIGGFGERGREAIIPVTRPGRAMELMQQSGLGAMWDRLAVGGGRGGGPLVSFPGAVIQDATDADLVAQRVGVALSIRMVNA